MLRTFSAARSRGLRRDCGSTGTQVDLPVPRAESKELEISTSRVE